MTNVARKTTRAAHIPDAGNMVDPPTRPPLGMRMLRACGLWIMDMDMQAAWGRARPGERWACLCGSLCGRGIMWPLWRSR